MNSFEAEGNSIDDAIERALQRLGVTRDKVDIEIISNSTRGLFGFGGRRAKVRATLRRALTLEAAAEPKAVASIAPQGPRAPQGSRAAPPAPRLSPAAVRPAPNRHSSRSDGAGTRPVMPTPAAMDGAGVERARTVLGEIVRLTGSTGSVEVAHDGAEARLVISGDPSGVLIGRRGQTLDAIEYVVNRIVAHEDESGPRLIVDLEGYRQRRREGLEALARRAAERARHRGKPVTLNPMSPRDRRIVHLALQGDPTLSTRSAGNGFYRKIVISPSRREK